MKRDEKIPSFNQEDGLPSSPTAERKAEVKMEEVEKEEEEKKVAPTCMPARERTW